ncbi:alkene reductase [Mesohalobacter halotolerans]|uniref:Alkene reductase n=1 Tax=Mesohalobacter halotolerans TaxID=1883405 RepID=A0A4U5TS10_9FLAO|nr:alkene reductase [Mesohalobacter halotolerans]MBS3738531.1 alkene reductase [Psychroflexus sp.]TKS56802.1 alkene reductase [Mesohalobacter halotolerans]
MSNNQPLLQPIKIGDLELNNRVIMAPMTRNRADNEDEAATDLHAEYYSQRVEAGLIISEGSQVSRRAKGYINAANIYTQAQIEGWKKVTKAVHDKGGKIFIQLWHVGRISHPDFHNGKKPLAPSAINPHTQSFTPNGFKDTVTPKAMTTEEVLETIQEFKRAAKNAVDAGFDGIELHSSNGYLFHQFFNQSSNKRTDRYGGSRENRARFLFEVLDAVKVFWPENRIGVRLNPSLHGIFGMKADEDTIPTFEYIVNRLNDYDLAYLHLSEPFNDVSEYDFLVDNIAKHFRPLYNGYLMVNAGFDHKRGNEVIEKGYADMVAYGKLFISNPDLPTRFAKNATLADWDKDTFYVAGAKGYTDYPKLSKD